MSPENDDGSEMPFVDFSEDAVREYRPAQPRVPRWLFWALMIVPVLAIWSVNVWAITDYVQHTREGAQQKVEQALRDASQDSDLHETKAEVGRQRKILCAIASKLKVVSADCEQ